MLAAAIRSVMASSFLAFYSYIIGVKYILNREDWIHGLALGTMFGVEFLMLYWGTELTTFSRAVIFLYTQPVWTALGAYIFLGERLNPLKIMGLTCSFLGLALVFGTRPSESKPYMFYGDLLELGAGIFWAATNIYIKHFLIKSSVNHYQTLFSQLLVSIPILLVGWLIFEHTRPIVISDPVILAILYQGIILAFMSYLAWFWLVHNYQVSQLASFTFLTPLFGVLLSCLLLGEVLTYSLTLGLSFVAIGIYFVNKPTRGPKA